MNKTTAMNTPEAKRKRELTLAAKQAAKESEEKLRAIAKAIPEEWAESDEQKLSLIKSIYTDVLGTYVESAQEEGKEIEIVRHRPLADLRYFMFLASQRKLNPFKNQIHAVYIWDSNAKQEKLVPITGIDGFASLAQRTGRYAGLGETRFTMYPADHPKYPGMPESASVDVYAYNPITGQREIVTTATVWWEEYAKYKEVWRYDKEQGKKVPTGEFELNSTWKNRPKGQLEKCAQALGLRRAFPEETGGLYAIQEVDRLRDKPNAIEGETSGQPTTRDRIKEALAARKKEGKSVTKGDVPQPANGVYEPDSIKSPEHTEKIANEQLTEAGKPMNRERDDIEGSHANT